MFGRSGTAVRAASDAEDRLTLAIAEAIEARIGIGDISPWELPIVEACRSLIAETISPLPLVSYRGGYPTAPQPPILALPDPDETRRETIARLIDNLTGFGYCWLRPYAWFANGYPAAVRVLDANQATATFTPEGRIDQIWHGGRTYEPGRLLEGGMVHIPWRRPQAGTLGVHPFHASWRILEALAALWSMASSYWEAGFPSLALRIEQAMTKDQRAELKAELLAAWRRSHEPAVIDRGGTLEAVGNNAVDAQLVESIGAMSKEVARLAGIPPSLVNVDTNASLTYSTTEGELSRWLKLGAGGYLARIEDAFTYAIPFGQEARLDTGELLRTDMTARAAWYHAGISDGWLDPSEARAAEGLRPMSETGGQTAGVLTSPPSPSPTPRGTP